MAYSDIYAIDTETAAKLATLFGGGMGRLREVRGSSKRYVFGVGNEVVGRIE